MLTYRDCLGLTELTDDEVRAIAEHEHLPEIVALELGEYLVHLEGGEIAIKRMILDDIEEATRAGDEERRLRLKATLKHFVDTHPENKRG